MLSDAPAQSLERRFARSAAWLAGAALLVLAVTSWIWAEYLHQEAVQQVAARDLEWRASRAAETLGRIEHRLEEVATSPLLQTALTDSSARAIYLQPHLESIRSIDGVPIHLAVVDFEGKPIVWQQDFAPSSAERAWLMADLSSRQTRATVAGEQGETRIWLAKGIVYARSNTVEGFLWASLRLADLPQDSAHRLVVWPPGQPRQALQAPLPLAPELANLALAMEASSDQGSVTRGVVPILVFASVAALLVLAAALMARWLARTLTRDLAALERFAGSVALDADAQRRALVSGPLEVASLAGSINQMLDRLRRQHDALESESHRRMNLLATCIANLEDTVIITKMQPEGMHPRFPIVFVNPAFERMTGYSATEVLGRSPGFLQGPGTDAAELARLNEALARRESVRVELLNYNKQGASYWVEMEIVPVFGDDGKAMHFVAIERDTTQRRSLEEQLRHSQKMEAIGTLAGGIAHDFNNVLAAILGNVTLAQQDLQQGRSPADELLQIGRSAGRARALVQQILAFSRRRPRVRTPQELGGVISETVSMLRATVPAGVSIVTQLPAEPVIVVGDGSAIEQILLNLGTNAWQALEGPHGRVTFGLEAEVRPDGMREAHLWVGDDGRGMDSTTLRRIFEPYFTTKPVGCGTGLGLAVVQGIVDEHGGSISVDSQPGVGTTFHVRLPLSDRVVVQKSPPQQSEPYPSLKARVLYVDDDEVLRMVIRSLLERAGCAVTCAAGAAEALAAAQAAQGAFDIVVSDFNMPDVSGLELARTLHVKWPGLPVVLTSGHVSDELLDSLNAGELQAVIGKEELHERLVSTVARTLHRQIVA